MKRTYNTPLQYTRKEVCPVIEGAVAPIVCFDGSAYIQDGRDGYIVIRKCNRWEQMCKYR